jgi:ASC-1-like (ASCH) protein
METKWIVIIFILILAVVLLYSYGYLPGLAQSIYLGKGQTFRIFTQEPWFTEIAEGRKTVEARVGELDRFEDMKGKRVKITGAGKKVDAEILSVKHYKTLDEYIDKEGWKKVAPQCKTEKEAKDAHMNLKDKSGQAVYDPARVKEKGGIVALHFKLVK